MGNSNRTFSGAKIPAGILGSKAGQPKPITPAQQPGTKSGGGGMKTNYRKG